MENVKCELRLFLPLLTPSFHYPVDALKCGHWVGRPLKENQTMEGTAKQWCDMLAELRFLFPSGAFVFSKSGLRVETKNDSRMPKLSPKLSTIASVKLSDVQASEL